MKRYGLIGLAILLFSAPLFGQTNALNSVKYYNLGVELIKDKKIGSALLNFKRASVLNPFDADSKTALNYVRELVGIPAYLMEGTPVEKVLLFPFNIFSVNGMVVVGVVTFILGTLLLSFLLSNMTDKLPEAVLDKLGDKGLSRIRAVSIVFIVVGIIYLGGALLRNSMMFDAGQGVVISDTTLLSEPANDAEEVEKVGEGIECLIKREQEGYYEVATVDGKKGWALKPGVARLWE